MAKIPKPTNDPLAVGPMLTIDDVQMPDATPEVAEAWALCQQMRTRSYQATRKIESSSSIREARLAALNSQDTAKALALVYGSEVPPDDVPIDLNALHEERRVCDIADGLAEARYKAKVVAATRDLSRKLWPQSLQLGAAVIDAVDELAAAVRAERAFYERLSDGGASGIAFQSIGFPGFDDDQMINHRRRELAESRERYRRLMDPPAPPAPVEPELVAVAPNEGWEEN